MAFSFLKKIRIPSLSFGFLARRPSAVVGIDIGVSSTKIVELLKEGEQITLKSYGEIANAPYLKSGEGTLGVLRYPDNEIVALITAVLKESGVTTHDAVMSIPTTSSFVTLISFPPTLSRKEIEQAIPYEARKYIPIPIAEVTTDWDIRDPRGKDETTEVLLVAIPKDVLEKLKQIAKGANLSLRAVEVETFSEARSVAADSAVPTAIINIGYQATAFSVVEERIIKGSTYFSHGALEWTRALEGGLGLTRDRAEAVKRETGLSERAEEREIASLLTPLLEVLFSEVERAILLYHRRARKKIQRVVLTGGGANLRGIVDYTSTRLGLEVIKGNPFSRLAAPDILQPVLREIGPSFSVAVGLALHEFIHH